MPLSTAGQSSWLGLSGLAHWGAEVAGSQGDGGGKLIEWKQVWKPQHPPLCKEGCCSISTDHFKAKDVDFSPLCKITWVQLGWSEVVSGFQRNRAVSIASWLVTVGKIRDGPLRFGSEGSLCATRVGHLLLFF